MSRLATRLSGVTDRRRVAVLPVRGVIGAGGRSQELIRSLDASRRDGNVRGVVLDIDSPGGGAVASDALYCAVRRLAARKPVVAWIRGTGASGAYFLACGATRITAFPGAVVGSIGVISIRPVLTEVLRRIGAGVFVTKTGEFKDLGAPWRDPTDADRERERRLVDAIFDRFTGAVAQARQLDSERLAAVTTGEVWLATRARELGLIDDLLETEDEAVTLAHELAAIPRRDPVRLGPRPSLLSRLGLPVGAAATAWLGELEGWLSLGIPRL